MICRIITICLVAGFLTGCRNLLVTDEAPQKEIKAFCIDFNWGPGGPNGFARPGLWADANPAQHIAWYKALGANVIQTFCVSCNGYAWYRNGVAPEQPGLKNDFLTEVVRLGHKENMKVMGYFCVGANTLWGQRHPDLSYGYPSDRHIPFTSEYNNYLCASVKDALFKTGCDDFMLDWFTYPEASPQWLPCELQMWQELMEGPFPGKNKTSTEQELEFKRRAIDRLWIQLRKTVKDTNPNCIIWLSCSNLNHPQVVNSKLFKEVDWLMNEAGDIEGIKKIKQMVGDHTRLITCVVGWGDMHNARVLSLSARKEGFGVYGFSQPRPDSLPLPIETYLSKPISTFGGNDRNIATLARWFNDLPFDVFKNEKGEFVFPTTTTSTGISTLESMP
jgi:hypothetical protein